VERNQELRFVFFLRPTVMKLTVKLGDMEIAVTGSPLPSSPVYNDISIWNFYSGKLTLSLVQPSTTNANGVWDGNSEYNDVISSGGAHDYYEVNMGGDVHIKFTHADVEAGQPDQP
jgi:hypothetical protein